MSGPFPRYSEGHRIPPAFPGRQGIVPHDRCQCDRHSGKCFNEITAEDLLCDVCRPQCMLEARAEQGDKIAAHLLEVIADKGCCKACLVYCLYLVPKGADRPRHVKLLKP